MTNSSELCVTMGIDLSDKKFDFCLLNADGTVKERGKLPLTLAGLDRLPATGPIRVVLETGTHSPWVSRALESKDHEVIVANPRRLPSIYKSSRKNDANDAEMLARLGRVDTELLSPIRHRGLSAQADLAVIRSRDELVGVRTNLINHVRGSVKSLGCRLSSCTTPAFHKRVRHEIPSELAPALHPVVAAIEELTSQIKGFDKQIEELGNTKYPETVVLRQVVGVGALTALAFMLVLERYERFENSRSVGSYLGLTPRQDDSGETQKQLRITKEGDQLLRRLLVGSAQYILGPFGPDCDLRQWGEQLMTRGGKNAKKRAVVAVARKLAVLLHSLWRTGEVYEPLRQEKRRCQPAA